MTKSPWISIPDPQGSSTYTINVKNIVSFTTSGCDFDKIYYICLNLAYEQRTFKFRRREEFEAIHKELQEKLDEFS